MKLCNVGKSGLRVSQVGLGCNNFGWTIDEAASSLVVGKALELGVTLFDTADYYGMIPGDSEAVLGKIVKGSRDRVILSTKFGVPATGGHPDNSRSFILRAAEASLRRLQTDWIDLYMIHWPDDTTPMDETLRALDDLVRSGKVRYIACSNLAPWRMVESKWIAREASTHGFIAAQNEYSLLHRDVEREMIPALHAYGMGLIPYFPLASGMLTGKYLHNDPNGRLSSNFLKLGDRFNTPVNMAKVRRLDQFANKRGRSLVEVALSWLAGNPIVSGIIAGATSPEQVEQNVRAVQWTLSPDDREAIDLALTYNAAAETSAA